MIRSSLFAISCTLLSVTISNGQESPVGKIDKDGTAMIVIESNQAKNILKNHSALNGQEINPDVILLTELSSGQICLTGYEKDATGKVTYGFRIQCSQDDENNLIIRKGNYMERTSGTGF